MNTLAWTARISFVGVAAALAACGASGDSPSSAPPSPQPAQPGADGGNSGSFGDASAGCTSNADCPAGFSCKLSTQGEVTTGTCVASGGPSPDAGRSSASDAGIAPGSSDAGASTAWGKPWGIALDANYVYFTDYEYPGAVVRQSKTGGAAVALIPNRDGPAGIAVDSMNLYWTEMGNDDPSHCTVLQAPIGGGEPIPLADTPAGYPYSVAVDATSVYWVAPTGDPTAAAVMKVPIGGGTAVTLATGAYVDFPGNPHVLAVDATSVYFPGFDTASGSGTVLSVPIGGGATTTLVSDSTHPYIESVAIDATNVYYEDERVPLTGGTPVPIAPTAYGLAGLATDGTDLYFLGTSQIAQVPVGGGSMTTLAAATPNSVWDIAVDATHVYWTDTLGGVGIAVK